MNRLPVYSPTNERYRVVYIPGGKWQFQRRGNLEKGLNRGLVNGKPQEHQDPWEGLMRPTERDVALRQLAELVPNGQAS